MTNEYVFNVKYQGVNQEYSASVEAESVVAAASIIATLEGIPVSWIIGVDRHEAI